MAAEWLVANRSVVGVGVDTASLDFGQSQDYLSHQIFSKANIFGLENVANVGKLPASFHRLIAMPIKIKGGTGAPCRLFAELSHNIGNINFRLEENFKLLLLFSILRSII